MFKVTEPGAVELGLNPYTLAPKPVLCITMLDAIINSRGDRRRGSQDGSAGRS